MSWKVEPMGRAAAGLLAAAVAAALCLAALAARAEPVYPKLTGRVVDAAGLLRRTDREALEAELAGLEAKSTDQLVVVTLPSLQGYEIEEFGYRLGRHWGIGQAGKDNGVLLIVAPKERKVRFEIGRGLEPLLTDAITKIIIENAILPRFRQDDYAGGIRDGVRDAVAVLLGDAEEVKARAVAPRPVSDDFYVNAIVLMIWLAIFLIIMWHIYESAQAGPGGKGRRGGNWATGSGGSGGGSGGGWSGGSGGGFSGGGGGFGGGGSSGSW